MISDRQQLKKELRQAGASYSEADKLTHIADELSSLKTARSTEHRHFSKVLKPVLLVSSGLVVGLMIVIFAQSAKPTSWLYPVQKLSDAVATEVNPQYRETVMMQRAQQVNELVSNHASQKIILATLSSYESEAINYKSTSHASYAAFDYCKNNLKQAANVAQPSVRQAILNSLDSLNTT